MIQGKFQQVSKFLKPTVLPLRDAPPFAKNPLGVREAGLAFHGFRSWSFEDKGVPRLEPGNERRSRNAPKAPHRLREKAERGEIGIPVGG